MKIGNAKQLGTGSVCLGGQEPTVAELRLPGCPVSCTACGSSAHQWASGRSSKTQPLATLTLQTAVCRMASKPPSGASRFPEIRSLLSSWLKWLMLLVRRMTFLKENGESALCQGSRSLGEMEPGAGVGQEPRGAGVQGEEMQGGSLKGSHGAEQLSKQH